MKDFPWFYLQIYDIGEYFTKQLLESRHRGAFELAYAGFVKMAEMLWKYVDLRPLGFRGTNAQRQLLDTTGKLRAA